MHIIDEKLQYIACPLSLFVPICGLIGRTRLTQALKGDFTLDQNLEEKLVVILDEMTELKRSSFIAPDWADAGNIREQLAVRRALKTVVGYDTDIVRELWTRSGNGTV